MERIVSTSCWVGLCLLSPLSYAMESLFGVEGVNGQVVLTGDSFSNVSGGLTRGSRLAGLLYTSLQLDTAKLHWWEGGKFTSSVLWIASGGPTPSMVGDYQYFDNARYTLHFESFNDPWCRERVCPRRPCSAYLLRGVLP